MAVSQYLLGVRPDYDGLVVDPCIGAEIAEFTVRRRVRGADYVITVRNSGGKGATLEVDGVRHRRQPRSLRGARAHGAGVRDRLSRNRGTGMRVAIARQRIGSGRETTDPGRSVVDVT